MCKYVRTNVNITAQCVVYYTYLLCRSANIDGLLGMRVSAYAHYVHFIYNIKFISWPMDRVK